MDRVTTGNPKLDYILGGGLPANSLNIVAGSPGSGKTILAQQFVFANAHAERPAVYLTTLSEPAPKLLRYMQGFSFFEEDRLYGSSPAVLYRDIAQPVRAKGFAALTDIIRQTIAEHSPSFLVIDSFKALRDLGTDPAQVRQVLFDVAGILAAYACTTLLIGEYTPAEIDSLPEFAVADGIIHLVNQKYGVRDERYLRVLKLRGSDFHSGEHAFRIGPAGLIVFPRLVTPSVPTDHNLGAERIDSGVAGLDEMLGGGLLRGSATLIAGPTGIGKTIMSLSFLFAGAARGERGLFLSFQENPTAARRNIARLGFDVTLLGEEGPLTLLYASPVEMNIDEVMDRLVAVMESRGVARVAVDSLADLAATAPDQTRFRSYTYSLLQYLTVRNITTYLTLESYAHPANESLSLAQVSYLCDNVITLQYETLDRQARRFLSVLKTRSSQHEAGVREFTIDERGISLCPDQDRSGSEQCRGNRAG